MLGDGSAAGRACPSGPGAISRGLLCGALATLMAPHRTFAQDKPIDLPEVRVIANTPLAPPSRRAARPAETAPPRAAEAPPPRASGAPSRRAAVASPRTTIPSQAAPAPVDPSLIERDKIPTNAQ